MTTLRRFYKHHGIRPRVANEVYKAGLASRFVVPRRDFALKLGNLIAGDTRSSPAVQFKLFHSKYHLCYPAAPHTLDVD